MLEQDDEPEYCHRAVMPAAASGRRDAAGDRRAVQDGAGIPKVFQERLFDRFSQADASDSRCRAGTGLGFPGARGLFGPGRLNAGVTVAILEQSGRAVSWSTMCQ